MKLFGKLSPEEKESLVIKAMILCPEIFGTSNSKFERVPLVFFEFESALSHNVRDIFSAGGRVQFSVEGRHDILIRSIDERLRQLAPDVWKALDEFSDETLEKYWRLRRDSFHENRLEVYLRLIDRECQTSSLEIPLSTVFIRGLERS